MACTLLGLTTPNWDGQTFFKQTISARFLASPFIQTQSFECRRSQSRKPPHAVQDPAMHTGNVVETSCVFQTDSFNLSGVHGEHAMAVTTAKVEKSVKVRAACSVEFAAVLLGEEQCPVSA